MKIGIGVAQASWPDAREYTPEEVVEFGVKAEAAGFDSLWVGDHFFLEMGPRRRIERAEPFVLLSFLAARTEHVELGTLVAGARFRSPGQVARQSKTLADLSGGRFVLGLGAGWHQPEFEAFGIEGDRLFSRLTEYLESLDALLTGDRVDYEGRYVTLRGAQVGGELRPPIMVGATGPRGLDLIARLAQGWNYGGPPEQFPALVRQLREREEAAGRPAGTVWTSASTCAVLGDEERAAAAVAAMPPGVGSVSIGAAALRENVEAYREAGCDHLVLHLGGMPFTSFGSDQLELAAEALGL